MSRWLALARGRSDAAAAVPLVPIVPIGAPDGAIGTNGTIGTGSPIPLEEVRAQLAWTTHRLQTDHGHAQEQVERHAWAVVRAVLLNDPRLAPTLSDSGCCHVCGGGNRPGRPLIAVLSPRPGEHVWLHEAGCHSAYVAQRRAQVDALLSMATPQLVEAISTRAGRPGSNTMHRRSL